MTQYNGPDRASLLMKIAQQVRRLAHDADLCLCTRYDMGGSAQAPRSYEVADTPRDIATIALPIGVEGVSAIYIVRRRGEEFVSRKIVMHVENGLMKEGKVASFEGFWDEFVDYAGNDPWVQRALGHDDAGNVLPQNG